MIGYGYAFGDWFGASGCDVEVRMFVACVF